VDSTIPVVRINAYAVKWPPTAGSDGAERMTT
jgi:hypothetical protein